VTVRRGEILGLRWDDIDTGAAHVSTTQQICMSMRRPASML
jgi:hypothetical protein